MSDSDMKIKISFLRTGDNSLKTYGKLHGFLYPLHTTIFDQSRMLLIVEPSNELMNSIQEISLQYIQKWLNMFRIKNIENKINLPLLVIFFIFFPLSSFAESCENYPNKIGINQSKLTY